MRQVSPDDEKAAFGNSDSAAGQQTRRDSARAAALTVGAPLEPGAEPAAQGRLAHRGSIGVRARIGIVALAVASVLLIGVSSFALTGGFGLPESSPLVQAAQSIGVLRSSAAEGDSSATGDSQGEESSAETERFSAADVLASSSPGDSNREESSEKAGDSGSDAASGSASADSGSSGSSVDDGSSSTEVPKRDSSSQSSSGSNDSAASYVSVSVSVSSSAVGNPVSGGGSFTFSQGATVYDALCACGLSVNASQTQYGIYVAAIGGLAEKEHGGQSGWMYSVNGATPMTACSNYKLSDGDVVSWYYVTSD